MLWLDPAVSSLASLPLFLLFLASHSAGTFQQPSRGHILRGVKLESQIPHHWPVQASGSPYKLFSLPGIPFPAFFHQAKAQEAFTTLPAQTPHPPCRQS